MKDKDEIVSMSSRMHDRDIPDNLTEPPSLFDSDAFDDIFKKAREEQPPKSTIGKFFKKLRGIITAIYKWLMDLLMVKK